MRESDFGRDSWPLGIRVSAAYRITFMKSKDFLCILVSDATSDFDGQNDVSLLTFLSGSDAAAIRE
jgi:hypothetical protein